MVAYVNDKTTGSSVTFYTVYSKIRNNMDDEIWSGSCVTSLPCVSRHWIQDKQNLKILNPACKQDNRLKHISWSLALLYIATSLD